MKTPRHQALLTLTAFASVLLTGCMVGPNYAAPDAPKSDRYTATAIPNTTVNAPLPGGEAQTLKAGAPLPEKWWTLFGSPAINGWVDTAFQQSPTLLSAEAKLRQAAETANASIGNLYPSLSASAGAQRSKTSGATNGGKFPGSIYNLYDASVAVSYQVDLFGGVHRGIESAIASIDVQKLQTDAAYLSLAGNVVTSAINLASAQAQLDATQEIANGYQATLKLVQKQFELGAVARADVVTAQAQLAATEAGLPGLQQTVTAARNQLAVYTGSFPSDFTTDTLDLQAIKLPQEIPLSLPSELVKNRPDVAAAEAQLRVASANVGVATANLFPSLTLSASYGTQASKPENLFDTSVWSLASSLTAPLLDGGQLRARKRAAIAAYDGAIADHKGVILTAFQQVANSLSALDNDAKTVAARYQSLQLASETLSLNRKRYDTGATSLLQVLDAQRSEQTAKVSLVQALASRYADTAALFQALGGSPLPDGKDAATKASTATATTAVAAH